LEEGFEKYRPYLNLLARANLGEALKTRIEASDIVQLTLLDAHRDYDKFEGDQEPQYRAWLKKILMHRILEQARYWKAQKRFPGDFGERGFWCVQRVWPDERLQVKTAVAAAWGECNVLLFY